MGKEVGRGILYEIKVVSYDLLIWYAIKMIKINPGLIAIIEKEDNQFRRAFLFFYACIISFRSGCKPFLFIDGTHLL